MNTNFRQTNSPLKTLKIRLFDLFFFCDSSIIIIKFQQTLFKYLCDINNINICYSELKDCEEVVDVVDGVLFGGYGVPGDGGEGHGASILIV
jgi:hypothetical protein